MKVAVMVLAVVLLAGSTPALAADPAPEVKAQYDALMAAILANDREAFVNDATPEMKRNITPQLMDKINADIAHHVAGGVETTYLCQLKQGGYQVHLWKLSFKDGSDDMVLRVVLSDGKLAGFFRH